MQDQDDIMMSILRHLAMMLRPMIHEIVFEAYRQVEDQKVEKVEEDLITISDAMKYYSCSRATIFNWIRDKKITSYKLGGKLYFKKDGLGKNLKERNFKNKSK